MGVQPVKIPLIGKLLSWWGERRIARMKALVASVPEGKALLELAEREKVKIGFDSKLMGRVLAAEIRNLLPRGGETTEIALNPYLRGKSLTTSLAHELRHLWQSRQLDNVEKMNSTTFENAAAFKRLLEADAFVFQNYMAAEIQKATGVRMPWRASPGRSFLGEWLVRSDRQPENPSSPAELKKLYDSFMASAVAGRYDSESFDILDRVAGRVAREDTSGKPLKVRLREIFNNASFKEVADLSKIPVIGTGENAVKYLGEVDTDKLLQDIWQNARSPAANEARKKYALA